MTYIEFPEVKYCDGVPCNKLYPNGKVTDEQKDNDPFMAKFCLEIEIFDVAHWRICHRNKDEIQRLRINLVSQTVKIQVPKIDPNVMCNNIFLTFSAKILMNSSYSPVKAPLVWNWMEQDKWGGNCDSQIMQSPIPIKMDPTQATVPQQFGFSFDFANNIPFVVRKNQEEVVIDFLTGGNDNGILKVEFGVYEIMIKVFNPTKIVFKFPAEHTIEDNRWDGEIVLQFEEKVDNNDKVIIIIL